MSQFSTTPRPKYDGPTTACTIPDGTYVAQLTIPLDRLQVGDKPALQVAIERVAAGLGVPVRGSSISAGTGFVSGPSNMEGYPVAIVDFRILAEHDRAAVERVFPAAVLSEAVGCRIYYMEPNQYGGQKGDVILNQPAPERAFNLPKELDLLAG